MWISMVFGEPQLWTLLSFQVLLASSMTVSRRWWWVLGARARRRPRRSRRQWLLPQLSELRELADWRLAARAPGVCLGAIRALFRSAGGYGWGAGVWGLAHYAL